jgi:hypothetical protein
MRAELTLAIRIICPHKRDMRRLRVWLVVAGVAAACSGEDVVFKGDDDGSGGASTTATSGTHSTSSSHLTSTGTGSLSAACDAPPIAPSQGACVTLGGDVECNPVTGEPCSQVCDYYGHGLYQCYTVTSMTPVCGDCTSEPCAVGHTCPADSDWPGTWPGGNLCVRYCCDDSDCGTGFCNKAGIATAQAPVGVCVTASP